MLSTDISSDYYVATLVLFMIDESYLCYFMQYHFNVTVARISRTAMQRKTTARTGYDKYYNTLT